MPIAHTSRLERMLLILGAGVLLCLVLFAAITYRLISDVVAAGRDFSHAYEVRAELEVLLSDLVNAETGQRGFLLTQDPKYLAPYEASVGDIAGRYARLKALTSDHPAYQSRFPALEQHAQRKLAELETTIRVAREQGYEAALRIVRTDQGRNEMMAIRGLIAQMRGEQERLLAARSNILESTQNRTFAVILIMLIGIAGLVVMTFAYIGFNLRRHKAMLGALGRTSGHRDVLLRELHHRLNNVLQLVSSMIRMQARTADPAARHPLQQSARRVMAIGRAHEQIYGPDKLSDVPLQDLLARILEDATRSGGNEQVEAGLLAVRIDVAVPLGLMISEIVAMIEERAGASAAPSIRITAEGAGTRLVVRIAYDPPGAFDPLKGGTPAEFVQRLAAQIGADLQARKNEIRISFDPAAP